MRKDELNRILFEHLLWLGDTTEGERAELRGVVLDDMVLDWKVFGKANLRNASFKGADLSFANFAGADLSGARFQGADLSGAVFRWAKLEGATYDDKTIFPKGFEPEKHKMRRIND